MATAFLEAGLVDELFLTQAPRLLSGRGLRTFFEGAFSCTAFCAVQNTAQGRAPASS